MLIIDKSLEMFRASLCPKHVETVVNNQHLQFTINHLYCCILLVFFLHALLTVYGHRNIKFKKYKYIHRLTSTILLFVSQ